MPTLPDLPERSSVFRLYVQDVLLAVAFVGISLVVSMTAWNEAGGVFFVHTVVSEIIVLPLFYLVLLLMLHQRQEQRRKAAKKSTTDWDE